MRGRLVRHVVVRLSVVHSLLYLAHKGSQDQWIGNKNEPAIAIGSISILSSSPHADQPFSMDGWLGPNEERIQVEHQHAPSLASVRIMWKSAERQGKAVIGSVGEWVMLRCWCWLFLSGYERSVAALGFVCVSCDDERSLQLGTVY